MNSTRSILTCFHKYQPYPGEFYEPILDFYISTMKKYESEYDMIYFLDSNWNIDPKKLEGIKAKIVKVNPSLRYYNAYKEILPQIEEELILLMDNDMIVYKKDIIYKTFDLLTEYEISFDSDMELHDLKYDVVSIYDTCGDYKTDKLNGKNKFCPYWFATSKDLLMKYRDCEWGSNMPEHETLGKLTEKMLNDGIRPYEWEEDKTNILFDGTKDPERSKDLGYYHIRAGSTPAYLLTEKKYGNKQTFEDYLNNQPKSEYLRQFAWYQIMIDKLCKEWLEKDQKEFYRLSVIYDEIYHAIMPTNGKIDSMYTPWKNYLELFKEYHGL